MQKDKNIVISFSDYQIPEFKEVKGNDKWVKYGEDNKYPDYLLDLLRRSPKHGSIIKNKAAYIIGKGFKFKEQSGNTDLINKVNKAGESLRKIGKKSAIDLETYGGFYLQIIWNKVKRIEEIYHLDFHKVRSNKDNTKFYFKDKAWSKYNNDDAKEYDAFNPDAPKGTQILYYKEYTPGLDTYTLPEYIAGLNYIEADSLISEHVLNNAKTGFTASKMINLFNGEPETEDAKIKIEKGIKEKYSGKKGSKIILSFNDDPAKAPTVLDLGTSDLTKEDFGNVDKIVQQNIYSNHQVTSPMLFGIRVEGQLGGRSEMRDAYEIFKNTYIDDKQDAVLEVFNTLGEYRKCPALSIIPKEPIGYSLQEIKDWAPIEYIYEKIGINPDDYPSLKEKKSQDPAQQQQQNPKQQFTEQEIMVFSEYGEPADKFDVLKRRKNLYPADLKFSEQLCFAEVADTKASIIDLMKKDKRITPAALAEALQIPVPYVEKLIADLKEQGYLKANSETIGEDKQPVWEVQDSPEERALTTQVLIRYSYEGPKDDRNRDFCAKLLELNRMYSRSEIEQISQRVGYSVWERRGGFYHNPDTGETTPYCRHKWMQNIVLKKK